MSQRQLNPLGVIKYSPEVLVGNWYNERALRGPSQTSNTNPEYETMYKSHFKQHVPWWREEILIEQDGVGGGRSNEGAAASRHCPLIEKKRAQWKADSRYLDETRTEYEDNFLRARPKPKPRPFSEEELAKSEERYQLEKAAVGRNERNRYGPRDFQPTEFPSAPHSFMFRNKSVHFTPTGDLVEVNPPRPTAHDYEAYLDAYDKPRTM